MSKSHCFSADILGKAITIERREYDVVVIGSGGAGSAAAQSAAELGSKVLVVSKDPMVCSDSKIAEGIVTVRGSGATSDSEKELSVNLQIGGDEIADPKLTDAFAKDSIGAYDWLQNHGVKPRINQNTGKPVGLPIAMGGHSLPRSMDHENGGLDYAHACWNALMQESKKESKKQNKQGIIDYLEDAWFLDVYQSPAISKGKMVTGGLIYHATSGKFISVKAHSVVIACGGLSTLYFPHTDTMRGNTGDSYAIAARAGAQLVDMEQIQFIPFAVASPPSYEGLVIGEPVSAGALGVIRDNNGSIIKSAVMVRTRAECAAAIAVAVAEGKGTKNGGCYLDLTENAKGESGKIFSELMEDKAASLLKTVKAALGSKAAKFEEPWEVKPSAHYCMGGVYSTENGEALDSNNEIVPGLFVAGQALGGLHGSNRLGSTSLAEGIVFGCRAGRSAAIFSRTTINVNEVVSSGLKLDAAETCAIERYVAPIGQAGDTYPIHLIRKLQATCWKGIGPARTSIGIDKTRRVLEEVEKDLTTTTISDDLIWNQGLINYIECKNMLLCAQVIALSATRRTDSLGAHIRLDSSLTKSRGTHFSVISYLTKDSLTRGSLAIDSHVANPLAVNSIDDKTEIHITTVKRHSAPLKQKMTMSMRQAAKKRAIKMLNSLPHKLRDPVLVKLYQKAAGKAGDSQQKGVRQ